MAPILSHPSRLFAALIAVIAGAALLAQARVSAGLLPPGPGLGALLWLLALYFTVLSNALVAAIYGASALSGRELPATVAAGAVLTMALVGVVYHLILAGLWQPVGLAWWADQGLHTAVPLLVLAHWLTCAPKSGLRPVDPFLWLAWPAVYLAYGLSRGLITGRYAYGFLDIGQLGAAQVALNVALLVAALLVAGIALRAIAGRIGV